VIGDAVGDAATPRTAGFVAGFSRQLLEILVSNVVRAVGQTPLTQAQTVLETLRLFAIALCPDPRGHLEVWRDCVVPLAGEAATDVSQAILELEFT
jgi:hypothetical protein